MQVVFEKRLGIAQLCLLLTVLVFMGFTRGAPSVGHSRASFGRPMREWGVRSLSFGSHTEGGWNPLGLRSRSPAIQHSGAKIAQATGVYTHFSYRPARVHVVKGSDAPTVLPSSTLQRRPSSTVSFGPRHTPRASKSASSSTSSLHKYLHGSPSSRTPMRNRPLLSVDPSSTARVLPLAKSNSSTGSAHPHARSAKRLARSAHLHEVKLFHHRRGLGSSTHADRRTADQENIYDGEDVFAFVDAPAVAPPSSSTLLGDLPDTLPSRKPRRPFSPLLSPRQFTGEENKDGDAWIDTDIDGSEVEVGSDVVPYDST